MKKIAMVALLVAALVASTSSVFAAGWWYSKNCYPAGYVVGINLTTWKTYKGAQMSAYVELGDWDYENKEVVVTDSFNVDDSNVLSQLQSASVGGYWVYVTTEPYGNSCKKYTYRGTATGVSYSEPHGYDYDDGYGKE